MKKEEKEFIKKRKELLNKIEEAKESYKEFRKTCKHTVLTWKAKYGGYYCELCDRFLPRNFKKEKSE
jgi:hypothetical protein